MDQIIWTSYQLENALTSTGGCIATTEVVLSYLTKASSDGEEPKRQAKIIDKGVCALCTLALPQFNLDSPSLYTPIEATDKKDPLLESRNDRTPMDHTTTLGGKDHDEGITVAGATFSYLAKAP